MKLSNSFMVSARGISNTTRSFFMVFAPQITVKLGEIRMMHLLIRNDRKYKLALYLIVSYWVHWIMFIQGLVI